ncbi:MAG: hypothetical protein IPO27_05210 [Bacteroidetes bacterium]|nr:hypothetical protein [Bacteroidota bacterium]
MDNKLILKTCISSAFVLMFMIMACTTKTKKVHPIVKGFVYLNDKTFMIDSATFFPLAINYKIDLIVDSDKIGIAPYKGYYDNEKFPDQHIDSNRNRLEADIALIKKSGFNTIRLITLGQTEIVNNQLYIRTQVNNNYDSLLLLTDEGNLKKYFACVQLVFDVLKKYNMKAIMLAETKIGEPQGEVFLQKLFTNFSNENTILAYDLYNEPLYFDSAKHDKKQAMNIAIRWQQLIDTYAPYHLSTIGLASSREVLNWDPNVMAVDFISFHPYEYELNQVLSEIYWYSKHMEKPWIIGETSLPADDDSIPYAAQSEFALKTYNQVCNCGGSGYSWWQYKDVAWGDFHPDYMGILNRKGTTVSNGITMPGTLKPVASVFASLTNSKKNAACLKPDNYYSFSQHPDYLTTGTIHDDKDLPLEGAIIIGWNHDWSKLLHTYSKADGSFELKTNFEVKTAGISATKFMTIIRYEVSSSFAFINNRHLDAGVIRLEPLSVDILNNSMRN